MFEIIVAGGWLMAPIVLCSLIAMGIIFDRFIVLRKRRVIPEQLVAKIWKWAQSKELSEERIRELRDGSPMGRVLAAGLLNAENSREVMKESIEETGRHVSHQLEKYLNMLGTIAAITPLLGLLGTVVGMIQVFSVITDVGVGNPGELASGISQALITTAAGVSVAIPSLFFYRYFRARVTQFVVDMEQEAIKLVEVMHGERKS